LVSNKLGRNRNHGLGADAGHIFSLEEKEMNPNQAIAANWKREQPYLRRRLHYDLHCIVDTTGKSLHAWFDAPRNKVFENRLKAGLEVFGCDPKVFTYSQPVRVPEAWRDGKPQRLVWLRQ
jgi:hypothetical protein